MFLAPLPKKVRELLSSNTHPGLLLDKYVRSVDDRGATGDFSGSVQKPAVEQVVKLSSAPPDGLDWQELSGRRAVLLDAIGAIHSPCVTAGPLTLHLARASALENAGICLHPIYGFAYIPGSALKGLAQAYAQTVARAPDVDREAVFGTTEGAGAVVFHDAWPSAWPRLVADIVNNHHKAYYGAKEGDNDHPPGDWEEPSMVSFLAVPAGVTFDFPLSKRRGDPQADSLLKLAREWLLGGLVHLGVGAKTAAGYGAFRPAGSTPAAPALGSRATCEATLELITPAFLAGPYHDRAEYCELRSAALRGLLRWWWRTLHAGFVDVSTLRRLEAAVWGDTRAGGAVRITVEPLRAGTVRLYSHSEPGLRYLAYGMDERSRGERRQRFLMAEGASWVVRLAARASGLDLRSGDAGVTTVRTCTIPSELLLNQATASLRLLCQWGGIGSKSRKGFGSIQIGSDTEVFDLATCREAGRSFREHLGIFADYSADRAQSPALGDADRQELELEAGTTHARQALDRVGLAYQAVAQAWKHDPAKAAWGLPRKIHGPREDGPLKTREGRLLQDPDTWQPPEWLDFPKRNRQTRRENARHASPIHVALARGHGNLLVVRMVGFPAAYLPDRPTSVRMLKEFFQGFRREFAKCLADPRGGPSPRSGKPQEGARPLPGQVAGVKAGDTVQAAIVEDPKKKNRLFAKHPGTDLVGPVQNHADVPEASRIIGQEVTLIVASISSDGKQIAFRWPR